MEERHSEPYIDLAHNSDTLFNLTVTSPEKSPRVLQSSRKNIITSMGTNKNSVDNETYDGVVNLSPFKSQLASKERAHRLITNIFELELDSLKHDAKTSQKHQK